MALLAYLAAHWVLVIITVLLVAGLGIAAYVLKNMKFVLAAVAVAIAGFMYQGAVMSGIQIQLQKDIAAQAAISKARLETEQTISWKDNLQAQADAASNATLETLASDTPKNDSPCFDAATAHRVWAVRRQASAGTATVPARRISKLFSRSNRNP